MKEFLKKENRDKVVEMCLSDSVMEDEKTHLYSFMRNLSVILRVINCGQKIHTDAFAQFCKQTHSNLCFNFKWIEMSMVSHIALDHSAERIHKNDGNS